MAKNITEVINFIKNPDNLMSFGKSFATLNGQPLDKDSIFDSKVKADAFAKTPAAHVGKQIVVVENGIVTAYLIDTNSILKPVGDKATTDQLNSDLIALAQRVAAAETDINSIENTPAHGISTTQISNWDKEVGAKALANTKANNEEFQEVKSAYLKAITFDEPTSKFTFTKQDNSTLIVDLNIASVIKSFSYDSSTEELILRDAEWSAEQTKEDQAKHETRVKVSNLIDIYTGVDGAEIKVTVSDANKISAELKPNSIAASKLSTDINVDIAKGVDAQTRVAAAEGRLSGLDSKTDTTNQTLESLKNKVEDTSTGLATKASQTDHNSLAGRVSVNEETIKTINEKDTSQDSLISDLRTDVDTKQTAAQVNSLIQAATIQGSKVSGSVDSAKKVDTTLTINLPGKDAVVFDGSRAKVVDLPAAMANTLGLVKGNTAENGIEVDNGLMTVHTLNVNRLVQTEGEELILNGGVADGYFKKPL